MPAQVIGTSGTDQSRILYIDKGAKDGLKPDMAVITPDGIVGKLKDVFAHTSQVLVISDQTSGAGVLLESTRLRGVLRGNALGQPQIINMLPDERVKPGERVITSGGDQIYPRGLPVGVVDRVVADTQNPPYLDIIIKPAANLGHLEELLVITQASDQMPEKERQDLAQSAAEGAAASQRRASDILAERLPGLNDPNAVVRSATRTRSTAMRRLRPQLPRSPEAASAPGLACRSLQPRCDAAGQRVDPRAGDCRSQIRTGAGAPSRRSAPPPIASPRRLRLAPGARNRTAIRQRRELPQSLRPTIRSPAQQSRDKRLRPARLIRQLSRRRPKAPPTDQPAEVAPAPEPSAAPPASAGDGGPPR